jgi:DNA-directed RNA polymerase specialized sigma subunit
MVVLNCKKCAHYTVCKIPCIYVDYIANGNHKQKESSIPSDILDRTSQQSYNNALSDLIEDKRNRDANQIEYIRTIQNLRLRIIASAALADIPQREIAKMINHSQGRVSQLYQLINTLKINHR